MYDEIQHWRADIDAVDRRLPELLADRPDAAPRIAACKRAAGIAVLDREREEEVLQHTRPANSGPLSDAAVERLFTRILHGSRMLQGESLAGVPEPLAVAVAP